MTAPSTTRKRNRRSAASGKPAAAKTPSPPRRDAARLLRLLTPREAQLLARLADGEELAAIAADLGLSPAMARTRLHRALRKLGVRSAAEATALADQADDQADYRASDRAADQAAEAPPGTSRDTGTEAEAEAGAGEGTETGGGAGGDAVPPEFDDFCLAVHDRLVQQTFLLTGCRHRAVHCAHLALGTASRQWPQVTALPDPEGWVRARAFDAALSPWRRGGPRRAHLLTLPHRRIRVGPAGVGPEDRLTPRDRALLKALRRLSRPRRRALVLHDALGLPAAAVAVEVEASSAAAAGRIRAARAALAGQVPDLVGPDPSDPGFGDRLGELMHRAAVHGCATPWRPSPRLLTVESRLRTGAVTGGAALLTVAVGAAVVATLLGSGPAELFRSPAPTPPPLCTTADNGSAGPLLPGADAGVRSHWCEAAGTQSVVLVQAAMMSSSPSAEAAATAAAVEALPVPVGCPAFRPCPTGAPPGVPPLADRLR
ncbi:LuxR C-terminal-related transcriptional regulator [Kitasatospora sp. MBT63]|uniref:LuxR C-terminal-related transcriptional regulator n=1 Tax=Kitasatospora sp. MBT63 TaxID=1444768 RepID=UPI00068B9C89|nr:LuxR C-terminal-related transcriptional regulator [Kitasatospora sp. MBT63]